MALTPERLPVSWKWLHAIDAKRAVDPLAGSLLGQCGRVIEKPFWCRTIRGFMSNSLFNEVLFRLKPEICQQQLGGRGGSTEIKPWAYRTRAWKFYPCVCDYRFANFTNAFLIRQVNGFKNGAAKQPVRTLNTKTLQRPETLKPKTLILSLIHI